MLIFFLLRKDVNDLISDPANEAWFDYSIEFCGGTHLQNTQQVRLQFLGYWYMYYYCYHYYTIIIKPVVYMYMGFRVVVLLVVVVVVVAVVVVAHTRSSIITTFTFI